MKIYRIENIHGEGPYFSKEAKYTFCWHQQWADSSHVGSHHPEPFDEEIICTYLNEHPELNSFDFVCGFESLPQLEAWFNLREIAKLNQLGYFINCLEVSEDQVIFGSKQVMFYRPQPTPEVKKTFWDKVKAVLKFKLIKI